jgi:hypothetical protein
VKELGYRNTIQFYYKLDEENLKEGMIELTTDRDIIRMIGRIIEENRKVVHIYVDHRVDKPAINEQPTTALLMDVPVEVEVLDYGRNDTNVDVGVGLSNGVENVISVDASREKVKRGVSKVRVMRGGVRVIGGSVRASGRNGRRVNGRGSSRVNCRGGSMGKVNGGARENGRGSASRLNLRDEGNESDDFGRSIPLSDLYETDDEDNDLFTYNVEHNIKNNVDWFPQFGCMISTNFGDDGVESDYADSDSLISLDSDEEEGDQPRKKRYPEFNAVHDMNKNITFTVGHIFKDRHDFRKMLKLYAIQNRLILCINTMIG